MGTPSTLKCGGRMMLTFSPIVEYRDQLPTRMPALITPIGGSNSMTARLRWAVGGGDAAATPRMRPVAALRNRATSPAAIRSFSRTNLAGNKKPRFT